MFENFGNNTSSMSRLEFSFKMSKMSFHKIYAAGLEVDQAKFSIIKTLLPPTTVKGIRSFIGYAGFYRRFIKDFSKISRQLCRLLEKDAKFDLMNHAKLHLMKLNPDWLQLLSW